MELVGVFSHPGRDPRGWVVSVAFAAVVDGSELSVRAGDDAAATLWYQIEETASGWGLRRGEEMVPIEELAFDHARIIRQTLQKLKL